MKKFILTVFLGLLTTSVLMAQLSDTNTEAINQYFKVTQNTEFSSQPTRSKLEKNENSLVNINQTGIENHIKIKSLQKGDTQTVNQDGQNNNYEYYNYYSNQNSNMQVNQEGNLNSVQVYGENSLMKDAQINQKSDFKSIVVKNYTN